MPRGTCIICGCTDAMACPDGCAWLDHGHEICSAHSIAEVQIAYRKLAARSKAPPSRAAVSPPLVWWEKLRAGLQFANIPNGQYKLVRYSAGWSALWCPKKGRSKTITSRLLTLSEAKRLCEKHRLECIADSMLANAGAAELVKVGLKGPATAYRKGRSRG
jgi:hypothetical protein